jgi:hypothetical protein
MGVHSQTPNAAVIADTGRFPMCVHYYKCCIKYWLRLVRMPDSTYHKACYQMLFNLDQQCRTTWPSHARLLLYRYNFNEVWEAQGVGNVVLFLWEFSDRVKQVYSIEWEQIILHRAVNCIYKYSKFEVIRHL